MGSETRFDYSVVGDAVNLSARLEATAGRNDYKQWKIIISEYTKELAGDVFDFKISDDFSRVEGSEVMNVSVSDAGSVVASLNFTIADSSLKTESHEVFSRNAIPCLLYTSDAADE